MQIELLYFEGCPTWEAARRDLEAVLHESGLTEPIALLPILTSEEAATHKFPGSPTVRVDGRDVDPEGPPDVYNLECRIYWIDGRPMAKPPIQWISTAVRDALKRRPND